MLIVVSRKSVSCFSRPCCITYRLCYVIYWLSDKYRIIVDVKRFKSFRIDLSAVQPENYQEFYFKPLPTFPHSLWKRPLRGRWGRGRRTYSYFDGNVRCSKRLLMASRYCQKSSSFLTLLKIPHYISRYSYKWSSFPYRVFSCTLFLSRSSYNRFSFQYKVFSFTLSLSRSRLKLDEK